MYAEVSEFDFDKFNGEWVSDGHSSVSFVIQFVGGAEPDGSGIFYVDVCSQSYAERKNMLGKKHVWIRDSFDCKEVQAEITTIVDSVTGADGDDLLRKLLEYFDWEFDYDAYVKFRQENAGD